MVTSGGKNKAGTFIIDEFAFKLTPSERLIFGIVHRFSGYSLGECRLKPNAIAAKAGVSRSTFYNAMNNLMELGLVGKVVHEKSSGAKYNAFRVLHDTLNIEESTGEEIDQLESENINGVHYGSEQINALFNFWLEQMGDPISTRVRRNRQAAGNLLKKLGPETLENMIMLAAKARYSEFAPIVADFCDLQAKLGQLNLWAEKQARHKLMKQFTSLSIEDRVAFKENNPELAKIISKMRNM